MAVILYPMPFTSAISSRSTWGKGSSIEEEHLVGKEKIQLANTLTVSCSSAAAGRVLYALYLPQHISKSTSSHRSGSWLLDNGRTKVPDLKY